MKARTWKWATAGIVLGLVVAACETTKVAGSGPHPPQTPEIVESTPAPPPEVVTPGGFASSGNSQFDTWRDEFALKSAFTGRKAETVRAVLDGLVPVEATAQAQSFDNQAEFVKPIWDYAKSAVSPISCPLYKRGIPSSRKTIAEAAKVAGAYLKAHAIQALAIESAEGAAEYLHRRIREEWGFADPADLTMQQRFTSRYRGKRYSFGYPACPNLDDQQPLFKLLQPEEIGVQLTEGMMMEPEASVSALVFHHPDCSYFTASAVEEPAMAG